MPKRLEIIVRNIGYEGAVVSKDPRMGLLSIDFDAENEILPQLGTLKSGLKNPLQQSVILQNAHGEELGFNPHHYAYHRVFEVDTWCPVRFVLPTGDSESRRNT